MKITVAMRVIGGFAVITLLLLVISLSSVFNTNSIGTSVDRVNRTAVPSLEAVANLKVYLLELSTLQLETYYDETTEQIKAHRDEFTGAQEGLNSAISRMNNLLTGEGLSDEMENIKSGAESYSQLIQKMFNDHEQYLNLGQQTRTNLEDIEYMLGDASFLMLDIMDMADDSEIESAANQLDRSLNSLITLLYDFRNSTRLDSADVIRSEITIALDGIKPRIVDLQGSSNSDVSAMVQDAINLIQDAEDMITGDSGFVNNVMERLQLRQSNTEVLAQADDQMRTVMTESDELQHLVGQVAEETQAEVESTISSTSWTNIVLTLISIGLAIAISWFTVRSISKPLAEVNSMLNVMASGNLTHRVTYQANDEFGELAQNTNKLTENLRDLINGIANRSTQLATAAEESSAVSDQTTKAIEDQRTQIEQVATATQEMNSTSTEMANGADEALQEIKHSDEEAARARAISAKNKQSIEALAEEIKGASDVINQLYQNSTNIGSILDVIRGIADQTNLLALNAAIEAARAGEQGRGFAVVADEVRTLASRTQESTEEIHQMIENLQTDAQRAVTVMNKGREQAELSVGQTDEAAKALQSITDSVHQAADSSNHIATAAQEQSRTAQEISERLEQVVAIAEQTAAGSKQTAQASNEVAKLSEELQDSIKSFKV